LRKAGPSRITTRSDAIIARGRPQSPPLFAEALRAAKKALDAQGRSEVLPSPQYNCQQFEPPFERQKAGGKIISPQNKTLAYTPRLAGDPFQSCDIDLLKAHWQQSGRLWLDKWGKGNRRNHDAVARLVGIECGVVSGVFNLESSGVRASDWRPRHDKRYHEA
jgi:hypothetical protein